MRSPMVTTTERQRQVLNAVKLWERIRGDLYLIAFGFLFVFTVGVLMG